MQGVYLAFEAVVLIEIVGIKDAQREVVAVHVEAAQGPEEQQGFEALGLSAFGLDFKGFPGVLDRIGVAVLELEIEFEQGIGFALADAEGSAQASVVEPALVFGDLLSKKGGGAGEVGGLRGGLECSQQAQDGEGTRRYNCIIGVVAGVAFAKF